MNREMDVVDDGFIRRTRGTTTSLYAFKNLLLWVREMQILVIIVFPSCFEC